MTTTSRSSSSEDRFEIVFFDVETTVPTRPGQGHAILEFGSILVCPRKLVELESYSTLIRPANLNSINSLSVRCNGITRDAVLSAPEFAQVPCSYLWFLIGRHGKFQYDPLSYALNFDEGPVAEEEDESGGFRDFSARFTPVKSDPAAYA